MKKDKLYTANRWNRPLLCSGGRLFAGGGPTSSDVAWDKAAADYYGATYGDADKTLTDYKNSKNWLGIAKKYNPFSKGNINSFMDSGGRDLLNSAVGAVGDAVGGLIGGGLHSGAGDTIGKYGGMAGSIVGKFNPVAGAIVTAGTKVIGGLTNAALGMKTDQEALNDANNSIDSNRSFSSTATSFDDVRGITATKAFKNPYKGGWFVKGKARRKNAALKTKYNDALSFADRSVGNNVQNIASNQMGDALASYAAFGGPLNISDGMGATEYGMMSDYLNMKKNQSLNKGNMVGYLGNSYPTLFALGGDMQSNGGDYSTGLGYINAGGTHEENPYEGVPMGIAPDGQPNLVEEGETVFNDYVFSNRIRPSKDILRKFHISSKSKITYAGLSKKLEKEAQERPNDPLSRDALSKMLGQLAEAQEQQKAAEAAREAQAAFAAMSPEEQQQVIAQIAAQQQEQQQMEQQSMQQQAMQEQQVPTDEYGNPVDPSMMQQQGDVQYAACGGHLGHKFPDGGYKQQLLKQLGLNFNSQLDKWARDNKVGYYLVNDDENSWKPFNLSNMDDGQIAALFKNQSFRNALAGKDRRMADAYSRGYDLGVRKYDPMKHITLSGSMDNGNFRAWDGNNFRNGVLGWAGNKDANGKYSNQSTDAIWSQGLGNYMAANGFKAGQETEAIDHLLANGDLKSFQDLMANTDAYKNTTKLLQDNEDLRRQYYYGLRNIDGIGDRARKIVEGVVDEKGNWVNPDADHSYEALFGGVNTGLRGTYPGNFWHSVIPGEQQKQVLNLAWNPDTNQYEELQDLTGYERDGDALVFNNDKDVNTTLNYYKKVTAAPKDTTIIDPSSINNTLPYRNEKLRYAGLLGPAIGLGLWSAGVGKPDYTDLDASMSYARNANGRATYIPIGNYLKAEPMDIWTQQNRTDSITNAANRALMNSGSTAGGKMAGILANTYNNQIGDANLYRAALEYNQQQRAKAAEFNRGTDMFNAEAFNKTSLTNAELANRNAQFQANFAAEIAKQKIAGKQAWANALYGNIGQLTSGIADLGRENAQWNMIAGMANDDVFGSAAKNWIHYGGKGYTKEEKEALKKAESKKSGLSTSLT